MDASQLFESVSRPYNDEDMDMILNGVYVTTAENLQSVVKDGDGNIIATHFAAVAFGQDDYYNNNQPGDQFFHSAHAIADIVTAVPGIGWEHLGAVDAHLDDHGLVEFGVLRAAVRSYAIKFVLPAEVGVNENDYGVTYVKGPWWKAARKIAPNLTPSLLSNIVDGATVFAPGSAFGIDVLRDKVHFDLAADIVTPGTADTALAGTLLDLLNAKTITYIQEVADFADFMALFSAPVDSEGFLKVYDAIFGTVYDLGTAPATGITAAPAFAPVAAPSAPTITGPTLVTVTDALAAAKAAKLAELQTQYNNNVAELRSTLFGSRGMRSTNFDDVIAALQVERDKQYIAYCAELDLNQAKMNADYEDKHEDRIQAHDIAEGEFVMKQHQLVQSRDAQLLQYVDYQIRQNIEQANLIVKAAIDWESAKAMNAGIRVSIIKAMYDAVAAWMHAKGMMLSNAGPVASTIDSALNAEIKDSQFTRSFYLDAEKTRYELINAIAASYAGQADLEMKSIMQNIEVLRQVMSVFGVQTGVSESKSPFDNAMTGVGTAMSVISGIIGIVGAVG